MVGTDVATHTFPHHGLFTLLPTPRFTLLRGRAADALHAAILRSAVMAYGMAMPYDASTIL